MSVNRDFRDLFAALNAAGARYLVVGGYAVAFHAEPRFTKDLDIWVEASGPNAARVMTALREFGTPLANLADGDLAQPELVFQIGIPPNRIDLVTSIEGVAFSEAWPRRASTRYGDQPIAVIGREDLTENKRACGRPQDLLDLDLLQRHT